MLFRSNNAKSNAAVIVVVVGIAPISNKDKTLFIANRAQKCSEINAYLLAAPNIFIKRRNKSISGLPKMVFGNKATDGGFLILDLAEKDKMVRDYPEASKFLKYYQGADSFINGETRYCLWITDDDIEEAEAITPIRQRLESVKAFRLKSKAPCTVKCADTPHLFKQRAHRDGKALLVPRVSSERRNHLPIGFVDSETIASDATQVIYGADLLTFATLSNRMHTIWLKAVGGKLKNDYRYSNLVYDSFPFPRITSVEKYELEGLAQEILNVRDENFDMTLGEMYNPETMPEALRKAHHQLDLAVERIYCAEPFTSDEERLEHLFKLYAKMTKK